MSTTPEKAAAPQLEKKPVKFSNLLLGAGLNLFEVTTLGQVSLSLLSFPAFQAPWRARAPEKKPNHRLTLSLSV
jgi:hypothetical protein